LLFHFFHGPPEAFGNRFLVIDDDVPEGAIFGKVFVDEIFGEEF
jgi:hypothetical protein